MLTVIVPSLELFDERTQEFIDKPSVTIELEHSLVSLSKWESKWEIPFLGDKEKTNEQTLDYIKCMTLSKDIPEEAYERLSQANIEAINKYISAKMTATWFRENEPQGPKRREVITAELMYHWLVALQIPFEVQEWHISRLLTLVKVCNQKNQPEKKMGKQQILQRNRQLNAERQARLNTKG